MREFRADHVSAASFFGVTTCSVTAAVGRGDLLPSATKLACRVCQHDRDTQIMVTIWITVEPG